MLVQWVGSKEVAFQYLLIKIVNKTVGLTGRDQKKVWDLEMSGLNEDTYLEVIRVGWW